MILKTINENELDSFVKKQPHSHFMQTSAWADVAKSRTQIPHLLGLYDGEELKASVLLLEKKVLRWSTFYIPRGFVIDYQDENLLHEMLVALKKYVYQHNGLYFRFDPAILWNILDENAEIKESFPLSKKLIDFFIKEGALWKGKTTHFSEMSNPRFTFRVPLEKDLLTQCHPTTRKILRRNNPYGLEIYKGSEKDMPLFYQVMSDTARQKDIYLEPYSYFADFYHYLAAKDMADLWIAKVNIAQLKEHYRRKIEQLANEISVAEQENANKKQKAKKNDLVSQHQKLIKEEMQLHDISEEEVILSAIITTRFQDTVSTVHGGNNELLRYLFANYELYYQILKDAKEHSYQWGDLFGTEGKIDKNSEIYGIYLFKARFGGLYEEYIGEFDVIVRKWTSFLIQKALHFRRKWLIKHQKKEQTK